jgi:hypothetical protein
MTTGERAKPVLLHLSQNAARDRRGDGRSYPLASKSIGASRFLTGIASLAS